MKIHNNILLFIIILLVLPLYNCLAQELHGTVSYPKYIGGLNALKEFINQNIVYPKESSEEKISGVVIVSYIINESGKIEDIKLVRGLNQIYNDDAIRITGLITGWQPAIQFGKPISVRIYMPIEFCIDKNEDAHNIPISGIVLDKSNEKPICGVLILVKGTSNGCTTDENGYYQITVPGEKSEIEFSSIGYEKKIEKVENNQTINVALVPHEYIIDFTSCEMK